MEVCASAYEKLALAHLKSMMVLYTAGLAGCTREGEMCRLGWLLPTETPLWRPPVLKLFALCISPVLDAGRLSGCTVQL